MSILDKLTGKGGEGQSTDQQLEQYKQKYASVLRTIEQQGVRLSNLHVQDGKLFLKGVAPSQNAKNAVWDQIKLVNPQHDDIIADIEAAPSEAPGGGGTGAAGATGTQPGGQTYTVQPGDTLSKIAKQFYGDANAYMHIFDANRDKLNDPNMIKVGQVLTIPPR